MAVYAASNHAIEGYFLREAGADRGPRDGGGDQGRRRPRLVAQAIVAAATGVKPELRYTVGPRPDA